MNTGTRAYQRTARHADRERLILDHVDYVGRLLSTMTIAVKNQDERENLEAAGMIGLIEAANNFDATLGVPFRTFSYPRIRGAILDELRKLAPVSQKMLRQIGLVKKAYQQLEPPVLPEALAAKTNLTLDQIKAVLEAMRFLEPEDWNDFSSVIHRNWRSSSQSPADEAEMLEMKMLLTESIQKLPEQEKLAVMMYYTDELNLAEIGAVLSLSESRVSRILAAAKFRLKELVESRVK